MFITIEPEAMDFDDIIRDLEIWYQVDMDCIFRLLAIAKHGEKAKYPDKNGKTFQLTTKEKEIFCFGCSPYSALEQSFIREYRRRLNSEELQVYIEMINDSKINLNNKESAIQFREELKQALAKTNNSVTRKKLELKLKIAISNVKKFDNRAFWSNAIKPLISSALGISMKQGLKPPMIMTLFSKKCPRV